jgi:predicted acyl esterase
MGAHRQETRDGMRIEWNAPIPMDDGVVLRADVFLPALPGRYPVILTYGPYGKGLSFQDAHFAWRWQALVRDVPQVLSGSTATYVAWELVDPERWVPDGYAVVRVDGRGCGESPGRIDCFSPRETQDYHDCIEWAAAQPWSTGKVGLNGVSYYAINQWLAAASQPPHLAAMCAWEGAADSYRDFSRHGGILTTFGQLLYDGQIKSVQHGLGPRGLRSRATGETISGDRALSEEALGANRADLFGDHLAHPLDDEFHRTRSPDWSKVKVPFLAGGNWGGQGLHLRGATEAFMRAAAPRKWLEIHGLEHWTEFYTPYGEALQKRFFAHFLKGEDNGWDQEPPVRLKVRHPNNRFVERTETEWPIARTRWTRFYLDPDGLRLSPTPPLRPASLTYEALGDGLTFLSDPMTEPTEITGPAAARLAVSSSTADADLFLVLRAFSPDLKEAAFRGANDPLSPVSLGWLRASHRKLDPDLSTPWRPYHSHDEVQPLTPGEPVGLDVEIWPTSIVIPPGWRIGLSVRGRDYVHPAAPPRGVMGPPTPTGVSPLWHDDARDRPPAEFEGRNTLHFDPADPAYLLAPVIPPA